MRLHGDHRSVMVVTRQCHDPANTPPPMFCLMLACTKGGRNRGILRYLSCSKKGAPDCYREVPTVYLLFCDFLWSSRSLMMVFSSSSTSWCCLTLLSTRLAFSIFPRNTSQRGLSGMKRNPKNMISEGSPANPNMNLCVKGCVYVSQWKARNFCPYIPFTPTWSSLLFLLLTDTKK